MPTVKERIWLWYNSESLWKTYVGLALKVVAEWVGWALILAPVVAGASVPFSRVRLALTLAGDSALLIWLGLATSFTYGSWCYASDETES